MTTRILMRLAIAVCVWGFLATVGAEHMSNVAVPWIMLFGAVSWLVSKIVATLMTLPPQRRAP